MFPPGKPSRLGSSWNARQRAGSKKTVTIEGASHAVMMSHADAVVELVEQAAAAVRDQGRRQSASGLPSNA
jgi:pimeloyl-ACP methyl ester carboxylesterase